MSDEHPEDDVGPNFNKPGFKPKIRDYDKKPVIKVPEYMMEMLRGRFEGQGLTDAQIVKKLSPVEIVCECTAWRLGDPAWAITIAGWMKAVGAKPEDFHY